jgi:hypothetical protein
MVNPSPREGWGLTNIERERAAPRRSRPMRTASAIRSVTVSPAMLFAYGDHAALANIL